MGALYGQINLLRLTVMHVLHAIDIVTAVCDYYKDFVTLTSWGISANDVLSVGNTEIQRIQLCATSNLSHNVVHNSKADHNNAICNQCL